MRTPSPGCGRSYEAILDEIPDVAAHGCSASEYQRLGFAPEMDSGPEPRPKQSAREAACPCGSSLTFGVDHTPAPPPRRRLEPGQGFGEAEAGLSPSG